MCVITDVAYAAIDNVYTSIDIYPPIDNVDAPIDNVDAPINENVHLVPAYVVERRRRGIEE